MQRYPTRRHLNNAPSSGAGAGSTLPGGAANELQKNDGAGAFAGAGIFSETIGGGLITERTRSTNTESFTRALLPHNGAIIIESAALFAAEWADGECATIMVVYAAKDDDTNTGAGGVFVTTWTKAGGVPQKVFDSDIAKGSDTGDVFTVSSVLTVANDISIRCTTPGVASNYSMAWTAYITVRKTA